MTFHDIFRSSFLESVMEFSIIDTLIGMIFSLVLGLFIFMVYKKTFSGVLYSNSFAMTLVGLSLVTTLVIMAVTSNVVLSLGMVGALSIVRFRAAIKEPIEIVYLFWSIAAGIVIGAGMIPLAVIGSAIIGIILIVFANRKIHEKPYILILNCDNEKSEKTALELIKKSVEQFVVKSKTVNAEGIELTAEIRLKDLGTSFVNKINEVQGVRGATLVSYNGEFFMITNKHITQIISLLMAAAVLICILAMVLSQRLAVAVGGTAVSMQYDTELFDHSELIEIDIQMKDEEWEEMLNRASEEVYFSCDVVINGEKVRNVGIRPKGNTSLSAIAMDPDTDRFSLKLEFDHYVEGQTCYGLDKLILNNNYADSTNMKEAIVYDMYEYLETDASLYNYARISVNGEYWGVYLALEAVEDSFLLRNYGTVNVALYKPESMDMGGGPGAKEAAFMQRPEPPKDMENEPKPFEKGNFTPSGRDGKFSMSGKGGDLNYTDSSLDSYTTIWEGEVTDTNENDHRRVVTALEHISKGTDLEQYLDVENVLKYMAVHTFSVNLDSLSGAMAHNYYLYESDGELNILPWDYNLSFGGMNVGKDNSATQMINDAIDTPFQGTRFFDALLENEEYLSRYHAYLKKLTEEYVFGGKFEETYERIRNQIDGLVATDPTGFYSYDEYEEGVNMLYTTVMLRAESIQGQLEGTIPSTDDGQRENSSKLVDASGIEIDIMGEFSMER